MDKPGLPALAPMLANALGLAGLLPQVVALWATRVEATRYVGLAAGYFYAALILSFLGGIWWGIAASKPAAPRWLFVAAVVPSLVAFASGIPWMNGTTWPGPSLGWLGVAIGLTALVDWRLFRLELIDAGLFKLRVALSLGLGTLTLILAVAA